MKKRVTIIGMLLFTCIMFPQKKKNGTIYSEHPAITTVEAMQQAFIKGDTATVSGYLADDFKSYNGFNDNPDAKGNDKQDFLQQSLAWKKNIAYLSLTRSDGAYPDALEYDKSGIWVQTWDHLSGVFDQTGVKIDMPIHRLYFLNDDGKIKTVINYADESVFVDIRESFDTRTNGTIYNHHEYINKVLRMAAALEHGDVDKAFSYFADNAAFTNLDMPQGETHTVAQEKEGFSKMLEAWTIDGLDVRGYPDYLEYELGSAKVVQSWWNVRLTRKSDGKKVTFPMMLTHDFNDDGMITMERGYYTTRAMDEK